MRFETEKWIESLAKKNRESCTTSDYGIVDIFDSLEKLGYRIIRYPIGDTGVLGFAQIRDNEKIIFSNSSQILSREMFTVAHELGHHVLEHITESTPLITDVTLFDENDIEREANYFAACFLAPKSQMTDFIVNKLGNKAPEQWTYLDIARMQTAFNVSFDMMLNRLDNLGFINAATHSSLLGAKAETSVSSMLRIIDGSDGLCRPALAKRIPAEYLNWVIENYKMKLIPFETLEKAVAYFDIDAKSLAEPETVEDDIDLDELLRELDE